MFPFNSHPFKHQTKLTKGEILRRLNIVKDEKFYYKKKWIGDLRDNAFTCELVKNARPGLTPVVCGEIIEQGDGVLNITGYYRVSARLIFVFSMIIIFGIVESISALNIMPLIISIIASTLICLAICKMIFRLDYKHTKAEFEEAIGI